MTTKQDLHQLIDELPEWALPDAERLLGPLRSSCTDPVLRAFMEAPLDDEPETPEELAAMEEAREDIRQGRLVPWETVRARLVRGE
jgi:hypothetical protein